MPKEYMLPSGDIAQLEHPDLWVILSQVGNIPDPITAKVLRLLELEGIAIPENSSSQWKYIADKHMGMFGIYSWCRVDKKLDLAIVHSEDEKMLGRNDVPIIDLEYVYYNFFRARNAQEYIKPTFTSDAKRATELAPDMQRLQHDTLSVPSTSNGLEPVSA